MDKLKGAMEKVVEAILPLMDALFEALMPIIDELIETMLPVILDLADALMPVVESLLDALMPLLMSIAKALAPLVKVLLPPLLRILGFLIRTIGNFIVALSNLPFMDGLKEVGENVISAADEMAIAANDLARSNRESQRLQRRANQLEEASISNDSIMAGIQEELGNVTIEQIASGQINSQQQTVVSRHLMENSDALRQNYEALMKDDIQAEIDTLSAVFADERNGWQRFWSGASELTEQQIQEMKDREDVQEAISNLQNMGVDINADDLIGQMVTTGANLASTTTDVMMSERQINRMLAERSQRAIEEAGERMESAALEGDTEEVARMMQEIQERRNELGDLLQGTREDIQAVPEETASAQAQNEIRRTWEPAQIRALRDGIAVEQGMTETISGEGSSSERTAANTEEQTRIMQEELNELRRQNELLETQIREDERRHSETTSEARRTRASMSSPNNAVGLGN